LGDGVNPLVIIEVDALEGGQVVEETILHGRGNGALANDVHVVLGTTVGGEVREELGGRTPARNTNLLDGEVVGALDPGAVFGRRLFLGIGGLGNFGRGPPVGDDDFHTAKVEDLAFCVAQNAYAGV